MNILLRTKKKGGYPAIKQNKEVTDCTKGFKQDAVDPVINERGLPQQ